MSEEKRGASPITPTNNNLDSSEMHLQEAERRMSEITGFRDDMSISEIFGNAWRRPDGLAMYFVCGVFAMTALATFVTDGNLPGLSGRKLISPLIFVLMIPATLLTYIAIGYASTTKVVSRVINALLILLIPIYLAYKIYSGE